MNGKRDFRSFEIVFLALLLCTVILFFTKTSKAEEIFSAIATFIVGSIFVYFKTTEKIDEHRKKARKLHLDK